MNPGVGDYSILDIQNKLLKKSPKATIGRQSRFEKQTSLLDFKPNLPATYIQDAQKMQAKPIKLGTFGGEKRWKPDRSKSPGVGEYDLTRYKNWAKASETSF